MSDSILQKHKTRVTSTAELTSLFSARMALGYLGNATRAAEPTLKVRSLFISDTHLGMPGTATKELAHLLEHVQCDHLIMIGDVVDGWALGRRWRWGPHQERALDAIMMHAASPECHVVYVPGNHDEFWRDDLPQNPLAGVHFRQNLLFEMLDGRYFWITHGDEHDSVTSHATWLSQFGSMLYEGGIHASKGFKRAQQWMGFSGFSASQELKNLVKRVVQPPHLFEAQLGRDALEKEAAGVLCGHIHRAELKRTESGVIYANTGDFVESASAIVEDFDGTLRLIYWSHKHGLVKQSTQKE